jgi:hypothetical protein
MTCFVKFKRPLKDQTGISSHYVSSGVSTGRLRRRASCSGDLCGWGVRSRWLRTAQDSQAVEARAVDCWRDRNDSSRRDPFDRPTRGARRVQERVASAIAESRSPFYSATPGGRQADLSAHLQRDRYLCKHSLAADRSKEATAWYQRIDTL